MPSVAIAGGTSATLGRAIIAAVLSNQYTKEPWDVVVLSRNTERPLWLVALDPNSERVKIEQTDYKSVDAIAASLKGVHTLISVTSAHDGTQGPVQVTLLHAAIQAGCKRFSPSEWKNGPKVFHHSTHRRVCGPVQDEMAKYQDQIECGAFNAGVFLNFLANGVYSAEAKKAPSPTLEEYVAGGGYASVVDQGIHGTHASGDVKDGSGSFFISLQGAVAKIPKTRDGKLARLTFTTYQDAGRFVAASLDLPKWQMDMSIAGDTVSGGELVAMAEKITGKKFDIDFFTADEIEQTLAALPSEKWMYRMLYEYYLVWTSDREGEGYLEPIVNRLCPHVKPTTVYEFLERNWVHRDGVSKA